MTKQIDLTQLDQEDGWRKLTNKFDSKCCICGEKIGQGNDVLWKKGSGIRHLENCHDVEAVTTTEDLIIDEDDGIEEWIDNRRQELVKLRKMEKCQRCDKTLDKTKDTFINVDRRTCEGCAFK